MPMDLIPVKQLSEKLSAAHVRTADRVNYWIGVWYNSRPQLEV